MRKKIEPFFSIKEIENVYIKKNFQNLDEYFAKNNQLYDFKFLEVTFDEAGTQRVAHGLQFAPKDIIRTRIQGSGIVTFNFEDFDQDTISMTATDACTVRFFVGTYFDDPASSNPGLSEDWFSAYPSVSSSDNQSSINSVVGGRYTVTSSDDLILLDGSGNAMEITLPDARNVTNRRFKFVKNDDNFKQHVINSVYSQTINGSTTFNLCTYKEMVEIISDGTNWTITDRYIPSSWTSFTPTGLWTTNTTYYGNWKRNGCSIDIDISIQVTGAPDVGTVTVNHLPDSSLTMDRNQMANNALIDYVTYAYPVIPNTSNAVKAGVFNSPLSTFWNTSSSIILYNQVVAVTKTSPFTFASGDSINLKMWGIPITGWEG